MPIYNNLFKRDFLQGVIFLSELFIMIQLSVKDKYELQALHKALMGVKFHPEPVDPIVQGSPMIADFMNQVVDELEKINWVTAGDIKYRGLEYKNGWDEWRSNAPDYAVLPVLKNHLPGLIKAEQESKESLLNYLIIFLSPYKVDESRMLELFRLAKEQ